MASPPTPTIAPANGRLGVLIVGLNPYRLPRDHYTDFLGLVAQTPVHVEPPRPRGPGPFLSVSPQP